MDSSAPTEPTYPVTPATRVRRHSDRASYDRAVVHAILDEALHVDVAVTLDGRPHLIPTVHARVGEALYLHGARANALLGAIAAGAEVAVAATIVDGLVLGRSAMHHSMNYRSVVIHGRGAPVTDPAEQRRALAALVDRLLPGRSAEARPPSEAELRSTLLIRIPVEAASAKVRRGGPLDSAADLALPVWAGVLPLAVRPLAPLAAADLPPEVPRSRAGLGGLLRLAGAGTPLVEQVRGELLLSTDPARVDVDRVHAFLSEESYWARGITREKVEDALARSTVAGIYRGARQVAFARVVTDGARIAFLADVFVIAPERGSGLGKWLVGALLDHPALRDVDRWLLGTADAQGLYAGLGFEVSPPGRTMTRARPGLPPVLPPGPRASPGG